MKSDPSSTNSKFVKVGPLLEDKVRQLLEGTELAEVAKSARIVVEIVKEEGSERPPLFFAKKVELAERPSPKRYDRLGRVSIGVQ